MLSFLRRRVILSLHEWALGRPTCPFARELEDSQWWSPNELRALQVTKLKKLLAHARRRTEFYRRRFEEAGIGRRIDDPLTALQDLPVLDKSQIRDGLREMLWRDAPGGLYPQATGGSGGEPLQFFVDRRRQAYDQAARIRSHRWFGVEFGDPELLLWGSPIERDRTTYFKRIRDRLFGQRLLNAFDMSPRRMDGYLELIQRCQPVCLFGYPSSLAFLVEHARQRDHKLSLRKLRAVFVTGEICLPHQREALSAYFDVPVADGYGARDAGFIAHQCPQGRMHVTAENVLVEIVQDGRLMPVEEFGEIVVTHLDAFGMPLIRYRTGDRGRLLPGRCACGRGLPLMDVVCGRTTDFLVLPDGTVKHALSLIYPLREIAGIRQFRATQHEDYSVTVELVPEECAAVSSLDIVQAVRPVLGEAVSVEVRLVREIPASPSGKFRYVESRVNRVTPGDRKELPLGA